jgi:hypothetical protein
VIWFTILKASITNLRNKYLPRTPSANAALWLNLKANVDTACNSHLLRQISHEEHADAAQERLRG